MLTVLLVLVSVLFLDVLFTRGVQLVTWVRSLDPAFTSEVDAVNDTVVNDVVAAERFVVAADRTVVGDVNAVATEVKTVETAVSTIAADANTLATDVKKL